MKIITKWIKCNFKVVKIHNVYKLGLSVKYKMNTIKKYFGVGALALAFASGCTGESISLEGTVKKEAGSVAQIVESSGARFGNESVKLSDPTYVLQIETSEGLYTASVVNCCSGRSIEALALVIEEGSRVKFKKVNNGRHNFYEDRIGTLNTYEIEVLDNQ